jgi:hypothetical protein
MKSSGPSRYAIVEGMNVRDSRVHNYPPRWNAAPSQELLVIRRKGVILELLVAMGYGGSRRSAATQLGHKQSPRLSRRSAKYDATICSSLSDS